MRPRAGEKGFTLIEVIIAVTLSGIVLAGAYGVFFAAQRGIEGIGARLEQSLNSRRALDRMKREIEAIYLEDGTRNEGELTFLRLENRERFGEGRGRLAFTTLDPGRGVVLRYEYRLVEGVLVKRGGGVLPGSPVVDVPCLEGIRSFGIEALAGDQWLPAWDTGIERNMPEAVRVTILPEGTEEPLIVTGRPRRNRKL